MLQQIIKKFPDTFQKPIRYVYYSIPDKIIYGKTFRINYNFLQRSQYWDKKQLEEYQIKQLQKLIKHAYETVPYYKKVFNEYGIQPKEIQDFSDLKRIPYLTKEIIQDNLNDLISNKYSKQDLQYAATGGSTGIPMGFYIKKEYDKAKEWAFISHMWSRVGYDINKINKSVILRGNVPISGVYEYKNRNLILSSYCLNEENMNKYVFLINKFNPDFIQAYPSSISILSDYINDNNIKVNSKKLKAVICASENLYDYQRTKIQQAFGVRVYSFYGHTEHACIGGECENSNFYHLQSEYGYTELINENGEYVKEDDEIGEIVATGFNNYVVPFIRYKTMDLAVNTNKVCSCGRNYKLIKRIEGRKQEYIIMKDGSKNILTGTYKILDNIKKYIQSGQFYQDTPGVLELRIIRKGIYDESYDNYIRTEIRNKFGQNLQFKVRYVDSIPMTKNGKRRFLIQKLNLI